MPLGKMPTIRAKAKLKNTANAETLEALLFVCFCKRFTLVTLMATV